MMLALGVAPLGSVAFAEDICKASPPTSRERVLDFGAANSRGSYEAGVAFGLLHQMRSPHSSATLAGGAGTSIGALNALLAALSWCRGQDGNPETSVLWTTFAASDWRAMFPGDRSCEEYQALNPEIATVCTGERPFRADDAVLSSNSFDLFAQRLLKVMAQDEGWRRCDIPLGFHLIAETSKPVKLGAYRTSTSRRYVAVRLRTEPDKPVQLIQRPGDLDQHVMGEKERALEPLVLPSTEPWRTDDQPVPPRMFLEVLAASLSQPPFVVTPPVPYCDRRCPASDIRGLFCPEDHNLCEQRFYDAAILDRAPLGVGRLLTKKFDAHVIVDPADGVLAAKEPSSAFRGSGLYRDLIGNLAAVATDYESQLLSRQRDSTIDPGDTLDGKQVLKVPRRPHLAGDMFFGTGAYFDQRFRRHDYYAGILDALSWEVAGAPACATESEGERVRAEAMLRAFRADLLPGAGSSEAGPMRSSVGLAELALSAIERALCPTSIQPTKDCQDIARRRQAIRNHQDARDMRLIADALAEARTSAPHDNIKASHTFARLLRDSGFDPEGQSPFVSSHDYWWNETVRQTVGRLRDIEAEQGQRGRAALLGIAEYVVAIGASRGKLGWQLGPATIPQRVRGNTAFAAAQKLLVPYTAAVDFTNGGGRLVWETVSYRVPKIGWARLPILGATLHWFRYPRSEAMTLFGPFLGLEAGLNSALVSDVGLRAWWHPNRATVDWSSVGGEVYARPAWGRLELSIGARSLYCKGACQKPGLFVTLGLADVNGLVYWTLRSATGTAEFHEIAASSARSRLTSGP
jgi:hypothetical protein